MQNILQYLKWRGDLPFNEVPICEADYLVLAQLAYFSYDGIVGESFSDAKRLGSILGTLYRSFASEKPRSSISYAQNMSFLEALSGAPRFRELFVLAYQSRFDEAAEEQFAAVSFLFPALCGTSGKSVRRAAAAAFRGTDSTLVGWKEDFNMAFSDEVPAQRDAVAYLDALAGAFRDEALFVCGHSKGGNLAVYASAFCKKETQSRIIAVRSLDGPGFSEKIIRRPAFRAMLPRTETVVPDSSIVGILLEHAEDFTVIRSYATNAPYQHDLFTWEIARSSLVPQEGITAESKFLDASLKKWIEKMPPDMRETLINAVFGAVESAGIKDVRDIFVGNNPLRIVRALRRLDRPAAKVIAEAAWRFAAAAHESLPILLQKLRDAAAVEETDGF